MPTCKQAGDLVPGDVYVEHRLRAGGVMRVQAYRVLAMQPGVASTTVDVIVMCLGTNRRRMVSFYRGNRVDMADSRGLHFVRLAEED
jgi:hypothetical protein